MSEARGSSRRRGSGSDALRALLDYLEQIEHAVTAREGMHLTSLLRKRIATHLPREVREELLAFSRASRSSLRAPVQFLRFQHRMTQLERGGERLLTAQRELPLNRSPRAETEDIDEESASGAARRRNDARKSAASAPAVSAPETANDDDALTESRSRRRES